MKILLPILILFATPLVKQPEYISIMHIGISDKPITTIIISRDKILNSDIETFIVKSGDFATLKELILSDTTNANYKGAEFGSFKITIKITKTREFYRCLNRQESIELFNRLIRALEKKENTYSELIARLEIIKKGSPISLSFAHMSKKYKIVDWNEVVRTPDKRLCLFCVM